jgi:hypothetical protein
MKPLLEHGATPLEEHLLKHARKLGPGKGAMERTIAAVGAAAATGAVGSAAAAAITGRGLATVVARALAFKWYAIGAMTGLVVAEAVGVATPEGPPRETSRVVAIASVSAMRPPAPPRVVSAAPPERAPEAPPPRVDAPPRRETPGAVSAAPGATREPVSDLAAEITLLDEARDALSAGNPARALARLDEYDRIPARRLAPEAAYIRIEALLASGDEPGAQAAARRFLAANPASPHAKRVRALLESRGLSNP